MSIARRTFIGACLVALAAPLAAITLKPRLRTVWRFVGGSSLASDAPNPREGYVTRVRMKDLNPGDVFAVESEEGGGYHGPIGNPWYTATSKPSMDAKGMWGIEAQHRGVA